MSLAYNLAASLNNAATTDEDITTLVIDHYTRTIHIPKGITTLGVESDDDVLRLNFKMPRYLGTVDLYNFSIRINYINAQGEDDVYKVTDKAIVGENITFSWLVGPTAVAYKGTTKFNVCMVITDANSVIKQEYNTAVASLPVLQGMECSERVVSEYTDILEQWERRLFGIGDTEETKLHTVSEQEQTAIKNKGAEVLATIPADYTSAVKMADESVRTKADAIIRTVEGEVITISDSSDDHLRGLKIFGKTIQTKTTGAQKLPFPYYESSLTRHGVTFTVNDDGSIAMSGTNTATDNVSCYFMLHSGFNATGIFTYKCYGLPSNCVTNIYYRGDVTGDTEILLDLYAGNDYGMVIRIPAGASVNATVYPMLNEGESALPYEPYTGGIPGPNPEWPQKLVSIEDLTVRVCRKNLYTSTAKNNTINGVTFTVNEDGSITANGTATTNIFYDVGVFTLPDRNYILSGCNGGSNKTYLLYHQKTGGDGYVGLANGEKVFTISDSDQRKLLLAVYSGYTASNLTFYPMISIDGGDYEPPKNQSITVSTSIGLPGIPVTSDGNYIDAKGQQWICDEIDFERGVYVKRTAEYTFTGEERWTISGIQSGLMEGFTRFDGNAVSPGALVTDSLWTHFMYKGTHVQDGYGAWVYAGDATRIGVRMVTQHTTVDELAEYLAELYTAGTPVVVQYALLYPVETPLTADEIAAFRALKSNYPNTTVLNDAGVWMNLRYNADTETWIRNLIDEKIAAAMAKL